MKHVMSPLDFTTEELDQLLDLANDIEKNPDTYARASGWPPYSTSPAPAPV